MNLRHSILGLATAAILTIGAAAPALAQNAPVTVDVESGGALSFSFGTLAMSDVTITALSANFTSTGTVVLTVADTRVGVDSDVTLSSTGLTNGSGGTLGGGAIGIVAATPSKPVSPIGDSESTASVISASGTLAAPVSLFTTNGAGTWTQSLDVTVTIPSTQVAGTYTGNLTATDALAPV